MRELQKTKHKLEPGSIAMVADVLTEILSEKIPAERL
jgi:hypothetical protein